MKSRRQFLQKISTTSLLFPLSSFFQSVEGKDVLKSLEDYKSYTASELAENEEFWRQIRQAYTVSPTLVNLNNGGVSPQPKVVQEAVERYNQYCNQAPSYYMWRQLDKGKEPLRKKLAKLAGCSAEEIAINRNSSEALETIIFGLRLKAGDEVVLSRFAYPNMVNAWKQRAMRDGIILKWVELDLPMEDEKEIVARFQTQISPKTKIVHVTHIINWTGQIMPVRAIADVAHENGSEVIVDAAHSFAHLNYKIPDLDCDYWGTSLHKWLCAPFGSGMLYVKRDKIKNLYPLFGAPDAEEDNIRKFEHLGTRSSAIEQAIVDAIDFHLIIGGERKLKRLQYLKTYWTEQLKNKKGFKFFTSLEPKWSGALVLLDVEGKTPYEVEKYLMLKHHIHTTTITHQGVQGIRVTPNVYTLTEDLDRLISALEEIK